MIWVGWASGAAAAACSRGPHRWQHAREPILRRYGDSPARRPLRLRPPSLRRAQRARARSQAGGGVRPCIQQPRHDVRMPCGARPPPPPPPERSSGRAAILLATIRARLAARGARGTHIAQGRAGGCATHAACASRAGDFALLGISACGCCMCAREGGRLRALPASTYRRLVLTARARVRTCGHARIDGRAHTRDACAGVYAHMRPCGSASSQPATANPAQQGARHLLAGSHLCPCVVPCAVPSVVPCVVPCAVPCAVPRVRRRLAARPDTHPGWRRHAWA